MAKPRRPKHSQTRKTAKRAGFRSGLEHKIALELEAAGVEYEYEPFRVKYERSCTYKPDFVLPSGVIVEAKGRFTSADRTKHLLIKAQHPDLDIRFVFQVDNTLRKGSTTRYSDWCEQHGFQYAMLTIPEEWYDEG